MYSYTARVHELLVVISDMDKGVYERTMVSQSTEKEEGQFTEDRFVR